MFLIPVFAGVATLLALLVAIFACLASWLAIPQIQNLIATLPGSTRGAQVSASEMTTAIPSPSSAVATTGVSFPVSNHANMLFATNVPDRNPAW